MSNNSIDNPQAADQLLNALGEQLAARGESYTLAVVGGSALLALGFISRPTRDVDVLAIVENHELVSARPLPAILLPAKSCSTLLTGVARTTRLRATSVSWDRFSPTSE